MTRSHLLRASVAFASGALLSLLSAPANLHYLHWFAYLPMFWVLQAGHTKENRIYSLIYGTSAVFFIFRWVAQTIILFSNLPTPVAYLALMLFSVGFGLPYTVLWTQVHPFRRRFGAWWTVLIPAWLVVIEFVSMSLILFPYNQGVSQFQFAPTWQLISVTGMWGLSFLVLWVNAAMAEHLYARRDGRAHPIYGVCLAWSTLFLISIWGTLRFNRIEAALQQAPVLRVAQIQSGKTMTHLLSKSRRDALLDWIDATRLIPKGAVDLVIWSEGSSPYNVHEGAVYDLIQGLTRAGQFELIVGGGTFNVIDDPETGERKLEAYNSVYLFGKDGEIAGRYDKNVPLPFGEYIPGATYFPWLRDLIQGPGDFYAGTETNVLVGERRIATPICYEAILPAICSGFNAPDLFVNVTNDGWFGDTAAPYQHAMLAGIRATELGVPMVRAGYTGLSMVIEPHGLIHSQTQPFVKENRIIGVRELTVPTIYGRFGDWFVSLCALALIGAMVRRPTAK